MSAERARAIAISRVSTWTGTSPRAVRSALRRCTMRASSALIVTGSTSVSVALAIPGPRIEAPRMTSSGSVARRRRPRARAIWVMPQPCRSAAADGMAHVSRTRRADWYGRGSTASDAAARLFRPGPPATAPDLAAQLWDDGPDDPDEPNGEDPDGNDTSINGNLERRPAIGSRNGDGGDDRGLPRPADDLGVADRRAGRRDVAGGAARRCSRVVLLDGLLQRAGEGRYATDRAVGPGRRQRRQARGGLDGHRRGDHRPRNG